MKSPYSREATLTPEERAVEPTLPEPPRSSMDERPKVRYRIHPAARILVRGPWEALATVLIGVGVVMLMQPFAIELYTWSFVTTLVGTVMFMIVSHFPE